MRHRTALAAVLLVGTGLTGCDSGTPEAPAGSGTGSGSSSGADPGTPPAPRRYVALGDSFTTAPFVPVTDLAEGCLRSSGNYPALVAEATGARLTDVSCSAATTADITSRQVVGSGRGTVPPQLAAVGRGADLVTLGIGGNDEGLFGTLVGRCTSLAARNGSPCADAVAAERRPPREAIARTGRRVGAVLRAVRREAPQAVVLLVGYPRLVAPGRSCPELPLAPGDRPFVARLERVLDRTLREAAERSGAGYVEVHYASRGHEVCSRDPWVNGRVTDQGRALAYHPFAEEQQAVAELVLAELGERS